MFAGRRDRGVYNCRGKRASSVEGFDRRRPAAILPADGGAIRATFNLSSGFFFIGEGGAALRWAPDVASVVYIANHDGVSALWAQPVHLTNAPIKAEPKRLISLNGDPIFTFAWSMKGDQFALARGRISTDAVLIS